MNSILKSLPRLITNNVNKSHSLSLHKLFHTTNNLQAGHSKWANIRHIKALKDGQKSVVFTRYARQIRIAIQDGGSSDPALNSGLRSVIEQALRKNMPMATIQTTIKKCEQNKNQLQKYVLQIKAQSRIFLICVLFTDNYSGLKMNLAPIVKKAGAAFVDAGHLFDDFGLVETIVADTVKSNCKTEDDLEEVCTEDGIDCGVEEVEVADLSAGLVNFICSPVELNRISTALSTKGYKIENSEHVFLPKTTVNLNPDEMVSYEKFVGKLKAFEGIEAVFDNLEDTES